MKERNVKKEKRIEIDLIKKKNSKVTKMKVFFKKEKQKRRNK